MENAYQKIKQTVRKYALPVLVSGSLTLGSCSSKEIDYLPVNAKTEKIILNKERAYFDSLAVVERNTNLKKQAELNKKKSYLDSLVVEADRNIKFAEEDFNKGIEDRIYSIPEMEKTISFYECSDSLYKIISKIGKEIDDKYNLSLNANSKETLNDLKKTVKGFDFGKSEIERKLKRKGLNVEVENPDTNLENWLFYIPMGFLSALVLGVGALWGFSYIVDKTYPKKTTFSGTLC